ncbi:MAG: sulfurtransferase TusA family protein [Desulfovibrionaceae bacterium]|nr:sulfurtransferase TusA family protein [Desulfovibrionaceae bacterium]
MSANRVIDCRGLSCPQPVVMFTQAVARDASDLDVLVDNPASVENVSRSARKKGYKVEAVDAPDQGVGVVRLEMRR